MQPNRPTREKTERDAVGTFNQVSEERDGERTASAFCFAVAICWLSAIRAQALPGETKCQAQYGAGDDCAKALSISCGRTTKRGAGNGP